MMLTSENLSQFIAEHQIQGKIIHLTVDTPTVVTAAEAIGVGPSQIVKSVLFLANREPLLVVASGLGRVNYKALADYLGMSRRRVKTASPAQVLDITGYQVGAVPPFGHQQRLRTVVDTAVLERSEIYGGGGDVNALVSLTPTELQRIVGHEVATLTM